MAWYTCIEDCEYAGKVHLANEHYYFADSVEPPLLFFVPDLVGDETLRRRPIVLTGYIDDEGNFYIEAGNDSFPLKAFLFSDMRNPTEPRGIRNNSGQLEYQKADASWASIGDGTGTGGSVYPYTAYASDDVGTGFSLTPGAGLIYTAILVTTTEIVTPQVSDFAGLWMLAGLNEVLTSVAFTPLTADADLYWSGTRLVYAHGKGQTSGLGYIVKQTVRAGVALDPHELYTNYKVYESADGNTSQIDFGVAPAALSEWELTITTAGKGDKGDPGIQGVPGIGDAIGPASSTDNAAVRFDGTGGKTLQNSPVIIADNGDVSGVAQLTASSVTIGASNAVDGVSTTIGGTPSNAKLLTEAAIDAAKEDKNPALSAVGSSGATKSISFAVKYHTVTLSEACTFTFTNLPATGFKSIGFKITNGGAFTPAFAVSGGAIRWDGGAAPILQVSGVDVLVFWCDDGVNVNGGLAVQNLI